MSQVLRLDVNILAVGVLTVVLFSIVVRRNRFSLSSRLFAVLAAVTILLLLLEMVRWLVDGIPGASRQWIPYTVNFVFLLCNPLPAIVWLCYLDYQIHGSMERLRRRWYYGYLLAAALLLMLISLPTGFVFSIDQQNLYHRGPGIMGIAGLNYGAMLASLVVAVRNRRSLQTRTVMVLATFSLIPAVGAVLQLLFYGILAIWSSTALAVLVAYLFVEIQQVTRDYLTGLYNRQQVDEWINYRIREYPKRGAFSLVMIDLDDLKAVNDTHGHEAGDRALKAFADLVSRSVKRRDVVARYAGDEFLVVLETGSPEHVRAVLARLSERVVAYNRYEDEPFDLGFSAGWEVFDPERFPTYQALLREADQWMYAEKRRGKSTT